MGPRHGPAANIVLFEANDNSTGLYTAIDTARTLHQRHATAPISVVSMSWGGSEFTGETYFDNTYFTTPSGHTGITFVASSGDNGGTALLSVLLAECPGHRRHHIGHREFKRHLEHRVGMERSSGSSGGGISIKESMPSYQNAVQTNSNSMREVPDVAFDAGNASAVRVYVGGRFYVLPMEPVSPPRVGRA